ncbi:MAG: hypothetical protein WCX84_09295 [Syntrophales bacterium]|nr:hypothetical protein [Syntrophales bacterium]
MKTIAYAETKSFYQQLDKAVRDDVPVRITFKKKRLTKDAKLWRRLVHCKNGSAVKQEFLKAQADKSSALEQDRSPEDNAGVHRGRDLPHRMDCHPDGRCSFLRDLQGSRDEVWV